MTKTHRHTIVGLVAIALVELAALSGLSSAQGGSTPLQGSSLSFVGGSGACDSPAAGKTVICGTQAGQVLISVNGGPFSSAQGPAGPQGVAGAAGPQGPQGVQGPAGPAGTSTTLSSFTCTSMQFSSAGVSGTGCVFH